MVQRASEEDQRRFPADLPDHPGRPSAWPQRTSDSACRPPPWAAVNANRPDDKPPPFPIGTRRFPSPARSPSAFGRGRGDRHHATCGVPASSRLRRGTPKGGLRRCPFARWPAHPTPGAPVESGHETHAFQRNPCRRTAGCHRRWPTADRHRHRICGSGEPQEQHLPGCHHPDRTQPRGLLRQLRRRAARFPAVQGNLQELFQAERAQQR